MLLSASPHPQPDTDHGLSAVPSDPSVPIRLPAQTQASGGLGLLAATHTPAHALHTPQQLAQLDAIARAQNREKPEYLLVSDDEKYLAAQLVYLASQHQASEYNRQKPLAQSGPNPAVYIPLSIQLPTHISELRSRQEQSSRGQAWFIASPRGDDSNDEDQVDRVLLRDEIVGIGAERNGSPSYSVQQDARSTQNRGRVSYLQPETVEVELLEDALGNSMFNNAQATSTSKQPDAKLSQRALPPLSTHLVPRVFPVILDQDVIETPPPLGELDLPQFPAVVRSRAPSQNMLGRSANLSDPSPLNDSPPRDKDLSTTTPAGPNSLLVAYNRPTPTRTPSVHMEPPPSPQLQLALETAITKDTIIDADGVPWAGSAMETPIGTINAPVTQSLDGYFALPPSARANSETGMRMPVFTPGAPVPKTSETHPINISQVIPSEYLSAISSHLETFPSNNDEKLEAIISRGSYFRIEPGFRLDRIVYLLTLRAIEARASMAKYSPTSARVRFTDGISGGPAVFVGPASGSSFDRPLKRPLAMTSPLNIPMTPSAKRQESSPAALVRGNTNLNTLDLDLQGSDAPPPDLSHPVPVQPDNYQDPAATTNGDSDARHTEPLQASPPAPIALPVIPSLLHAAPRPLGVPTQHPPIVPSHAPQDSCPPPVTSTPAQLASDFMLGNLYLSSCPGKKVRLSGPIKGRGAICRNLGADLARIKSTGVDLIVCCLDDDELQFLGAPWPEYKEFAAEVGLDILRLPMPEGLSPLSVRTMSQHMDRIIHSYTLMGRHVLVHCRGGVGRAGLVACTWMLKLGICGSVDPNSNGYHTIQDPAAQPPASALMRERKVPRDSLELLERVIYIIRRQRSVKAIETYEQVRFLLEFIEYIRDSDARTLEAVS